LDFIDCDKITQHSFKDSDVILLGGGDILTDYFLDNVIKVFKNKPNKIIAVSVGIPYSSIIYENKLKIIDYIFLRSKQGLNVLSKYYDKSKIFYLPDISYFCENPFEIQAVKPNQKKRIGICLSRHIFDKNNVQYYDNILKSFALFIDYITCFGFEIVLLPFNTNAHNSSENDLLIQNDLFARLKNTSNVTVVNHKLSPLEMNALFKTFYLCIPMRFHACLFSIYNGIPFLPVFTTTKINNLLLDIHWQFGYKLPVDTKDIPTNLDRSILIGRFSSLVNLYPLLQKKLKELVFDFDNLSILKAKILEEPIAKEFDFDIDTKLQIINKTFQAANAFMTRKGLDIDFRLADKSYHPILTNIVSYNLINKIDSPYNYGLSQKMFNDNYNYVEEWKWILKDYTNSKPSEQIVIYSNPLGLFNLNLHHDQNDYSGVHRSGWQYVYTYLQQYHNEDSDLYLDLYIDKTFHWKKELNKELGIIPYTKKWVGFVHHTFDTEFSHFNNIELLKNEDFIESLKTCKGLFVLSVYLRNDFIRRLNILGISNVPVFALVHPTETLVSQFDYDKFLGNNDKKIIHIGGWLRNIYSYYLTKFPTNITLRVCALLSRSFNIRKTILKGSHMNNYLPLENFQEKFENFLLDPNNCYCQHGGGGESPCVSSSPCISITPCVSRDKCKMNNWYKHFYDHVVSIIDSVDVLDKVNNEEFDDLLTQNVIFINLVDASAVNTLIECIVRNTPIIINRHPAVIELLGNSYPLYFNTDNYTQMNIDILNLLSNKDRIYNAHIYLRKLNKNVFTINYFIKNFLDILSILKN